MSVIKEHHFWPKVEKTETCWNWTAALHTNGYGKFTQKEDGKARTYLAHRVSFELAGNELIKGMQIDHICHNKRCINPDHLRQVTQSQNQQNRAGAKRGSKTGIWGVSPSTNKYSKAYQTQVKVNGKAISAGCYDTIEEAEAAVVAKRLELYTHNDYDRKAA